MHERARFAAGRHRGEAPPLSDGRIPGRADIICIGHSSARVNLEGGRPSVRGPTDRVRLGAPDWSPSNASAAQSAARSPGARKLADQSLGAFDSGAPSLASCWRLFVTSPHSGPPPYSLGAANITRGRSLGGHEWPLWAIPPSRRARPAPPPIILASSQLVAPTQIDCHRQTGGAPTQLMDLLGASRQMRRRPGSRAGAGARAQIAGQPPSSPGCLIRPPGDDGSSWGPPAKLARGPDGAHLAARL